MGKVAIVTGGSSGLGKEIAKQLAQTGFTVYEFSRRQSAEPGIIHRSIDVTGEGEIARAVEEIYEAEDSIDLLVSCAGFGISGAIEFTRLEDARKQLDVNFFGTVNACRAVLPFMRIQKSGRIVCISSVAAPVPIPFQAFYSASKAAINAYVMALANEVRPYGISVCAVQPGDVSTGFTDARVKSYEGDREYGGRISRSVSVMEHDEKNGMTPQAVGEYIVRVALRKKVKPLYAAGFVYKLFCVLMKLLPCRFSNYLIGMIYAR